MRRREFIALPPGLFRLATSINLKTAKGLKVVPPQTMLVAADEVIE